MKPMLLFAALTAAAWTSFAQDADAGSLRLVPFPKSVQLQPGRFDLAEPCVLAVSDTNRIVWGEALNEDLRAAGLPAVKVEPLPSAFPAFRLAHAAAALSLPSLPADGAPEAYALEVRPGEMVGVARESSGLFYALQTVRQLVRANCNDRTLPCVRIQDWPSLRWRCFQDDMTRGPSSTLDTLRFEASLGAFLKLNLMTFYMEYQYAFRKHPKIGPPNGSLQPDELEALVAHAKPRQMDILGNQQSFGHFSRILALPEYADLRETADVLTPVREGTYQLLEDLYGDLCPLLPFPWFNVCCDETYGLGTGPSKDLAASIGIGGVYLRHIQRVHDLLRDRYGKRMMMWGDILLQHPDRIQEVPKDTILLTWGYDPRASFDDQILPFARSGFAFFVCPGVNNWSRILPDFGAAITNIQHFVRDGAKHGALGMINTDWEDDGEALNAVKWHADAWAAECAWNAATTSVETFNRRVGAVLFGEPGDHFGQAVALLAQAHRQPAMKGLFNARFWETDFIATNNPVLIQNAASNLLAVVRPALDHLEACRREAHHNRHILDVFLFGARRVERIGQRMLDGIEAARLYQQAAAGTDAAHTLPRIESLIRKNRDAHEQTGRQFSTLWLAESKPYALDWTLRRYTNTVAQYDNLLRQLAKASAAAAAANPLPTLEEVGLAPAKPSSP